MPSWIEILLLVCLFAFGTDQYNRGTYWFGRDHVLDAAADRDQANRFAWRHMIAAWICVGAAAALVIFA